MSLVRPPMILPGFSHPVATPSSPALWNATDTDGSRFCGELQSLPVPTPSGASVVRGAILWAGLATILAGTVSLGPERMAEEVRAAATAWSVSEWGIGSAILFVSLGVFLLIGGYARRAKSPEVAKRPERDEAEGSPVALQPRRRTEVLRRTQRLPEGEGQRQIQQGAPNQELHIGWQRYELPVTGPWETTQKYPVDGAVETALPDDPTKGRPVPAAVEPEKTPVLLDEGGRPYEEAVPRPARSGHTERIVDAAAPRHTWGGGGTQRLTEKIAVPPVDAITGASVAVDPVAEILKKAPAWLNGVALVRAAEADPAKRSEVRAWAREQAVYLRGFAIRAHQTDAVSRRILETAERLERPEPLTRREAAAATLVVAYLRLGSLGLRDPFSLVKEISWLERLYSERSAPDASLLMMELEDLRLAAELEPSLSNANAVRALLKASREDPLLSEPTAHVLYLLCQKRAEDPSLQSYLRLVREVRRIESDRDRAKVDSETAQEIRNLPELQGRRDEKKRAAIQALSTRRFDILHYWERL